MAESRIANRYAKPLLELAEERGDIKDVKKDMDLLKDLCESSRDFLLMLKSPIIPHLKKGEILKKILDKKVSKTTSSFTSTSLVPVFIDDSKVSKSSKA